MKLETQKPYLKLCSLFTMKLGTQKPSLKPSLFTTKETFIVHNETWNSETLAETLFIVFNETWNSETLPETFIVHNKTWNSETLTETFIEFRLKLSHLKLSNSHISFIFTVPSSSSPAGHSHTFTLVCLTNWYYFYGSLTIENLGSCLSNSSSCSIQNIPRQKNNTRKNKSRVSYR